MPVAKAGVVITHHSYLTGHPWARPNLGVNASGGLVLDNGGRVRRPRVTPVVRTVAQVTHASSGYTD